MSIDPRKTIFDAARSAKGAGFTQEQVDALHYALDRAGVPRANADKVTGAAGVSLIKSFESLRLKAYQDSVGVWTIGYGHTKGVKAGDVITEAQADAFLRADLADAETSVRQYCPVTTQGQFDALVSFTFNLGGGSLKDSTLRRKHNEGDYAGARAEFARWNRAGGQVLAGLSRRRAAEAALYAS